MSRFHKITHLHQIIIVDDMEIPPQLSPSIRENINAARSLYPDAIHKIWSGNDLRDFIGKEFDAEVLNAFDALIPYSFKCDLARYCLMYVYGGIYFDIAIKMMNTWDIPLHCATAAFTEMYPGMESWTCTQTSLLWSLPGRIEWKFCIDEIVRNVREKYYGPHDHYPTAGALLGRAIAYAVNREEIGFRVDDQFIGEVRYITPERRQQNCTFVSPHRKLIGMRTKLVAGDLSEFALKGINSYVEQYRKRRIYHDEQELIWGLDDLRFDIEDCAVLTYTGARIQKGASGRVMYGPYVPLEQGLHKIVFQFSEDTRFSRVYVDIVADSAQNLLAEIDERYDSERKITELVSYFYLPRKVDDAEFRMWVFGDFEGELQSIRVFEEWLLSADEKKMSPLISFSSDINDGKMSFAKTRFRQSLGYIGHKKGIGMYGPYIHLAPGNYEAEIKFQSSHYMHGVEYEICANGGHKILHNEIEKDRKSGNYTKLLRFNVDKTSREIEVRVRTTLFCSARVESVNIKSIS